MALDLKEKSTEKDQLEQVLEKQDELETKDVENEILEDVKEIVNQKELSVDQMAQAVVKVVMNKKEVYAGPIPHPDHLRQYEEIVEGSADRLIKMAENQSEHRRNQEDKILNAKYYHISQKIHVNQGIASLWIHTMRIEWVHKDERFSCVQSSRENCSMENRYH